MVIYIQSPHGLMRGWPVCSLGAGAKYQYRTTGTSPNLIIGLGSFALQLTNLNVLNIKQSAQIFCFTSDMGT